MGVWTFSQLGGDKKELKLEGKAAPHGRPRQKAVLTDAIHVRNTEVFYPGNGRPTRHVFGTRCEPFELTGRFEDVYGGPGWANQMTEYVKAFVADEQAVMFGWGDTIGGIGLIESFEPSRESTAHVAWKMKVLVDQDLFLETAKERQPDVTTKASKTIEELVKEAIGPSKKRKGKAVNDFPPSLKFSLVDYLGVIVGKINEVSAAYSAMLSEIKQLKEGTVGELKRLKAGLHQFKTAISEFALIYGNIEVTQAIQSAKAEEEQRFLEEQARVLVLLTKLLAEIDRAEREIEIEERGRIKAIITAEDGDTWESLSIRALRTADRANDIRTANSATGNPVAGTPYVVPQ